MPTLLAGRYEFLRNIGSGSFGHVRLYRDTAGPDQSVVAIKSIPYAKIIQEGHRLIREIEIMLFLRDAHPHVIACFYAFATVDARAMTHVSADEIPTLPDREQGIKSVECIKAWLEELKGIQERVEACIASRQMLRVDHNNSSSFSIHLVLPFMNGDIDKFITNMRQGQTLWGPSGRGMGDLDFWSTTLAVIAFQMVFGMDFLHKSDIVHRDLKPENILLRLDTNNAYCTSALIADFGLACRAAEVGTFYVCTRTYRPPELIVARQTAHSSIDIWSLGCILYELVTWERLFDVPSSRERTTGEWNGTQAAGQLEVIMDIAGTPSREDIHKYLTDESDPVRSYLLKTAPRPSRIRQLLVEKFRLIGISPEIRELWIDLILSCLRFFPEQRHSAEDLCKHPLFVAFGMRYGANVSQYPIVAYNPVAEIHTRPEKNVLTAVSLLQEHLSHEVTEGVLSPTMAALASPPLGPSEAAVLDTAHAISFPYLRTEEVHDKYSQMPLSTTEQVLDATDACEFDLEEVRLKLLDNPDDQQLQVRMDDLRKLINYFSQVTNWEIPASDSDDDEDD